jgi:hypothetical protein
MELVGNLTSLESSDDFNDKDDASKNIQVQSSENTQEKPEECIEFEINSQIIDYDNVPDTPLSDGLVIDADNESNDGRKYLKLIFPFYVLL